MKPIDIDARPMMKRAGLSLEELSAITKIEIARLKRIVENERRASVSAAYAIANACNASLKELVLF